MSCLSMSTSVGLLFAISCAASMSLASTFKIDPKLSQIEWSGTKATGAVHRGYIDIKEGLLEVKGKDIKSGLINVDMATLTNEDLKESPILQASLVKHLKSDEFFNVTEHPISSFVVSKVEKKSATEYLFKGDLTIVGVKRSVEFLAKVKMNGKTVEGSATMTLDRTLWGLKFASGKVFAQLGDRLIKDEMTLSLKLVAKKEQVAATVSESSK